VSAVFHHNKETKRELKVNFNNETLSCSEPKYLGVTLDRLLTYRRHLESLQGRSQDFSKGGAEVMEAKALKSKNCL